MSVNRLLEADIQDWKRLKVKSINVGSSNANRSITTYLKLTSPSIPAAGQITTPCHVEYQKIGKICTLGIVPESNDHALHNAAAAAKMIIPFASLGPELMAQLTEDCKTTTGVVHQVQIAGFAHTASATNPKVGLQIQPVGGIGLGFVFNQGDAGGDPNPTAAENLFLQGLTGSFTAVSDTIV